MSSEAKDAEASAPRPAAGYHNQSQIKFTGSAEDAAAADGDKSIPGKRQAGNKSNESNWSFADDKPVNVRPSSRVLRPPGGGSNIIFG